MTHCHSLSTHLITHYLKLLVSVCYWYWGNAAEFPGTLKNLMRLNQLNSNGVKSCSVCPESGHQRTRLKHHRDTRGHFAAWLSAALTETGSKVSPFSDTTLKPLSVCGAKYMNSWWQVPPTEGWEVSTLPLIITNVPRLGRPGSGEANMC